MEIALQYQGDSCLFVFVLASLETLEVETIEGKFKKEATSLSISMSA